MLRITTVSLMALLMAVSACTTNEPELPPTDPSTLVTTVTASSRDRTINGLPARPAATGLQDTGNVSGEAGTTADECRNSSAPEDCVQ